MKQFIVSTAIVLCLAACSGMSTKDKVIEQAAEYKEQQQARVEQVVDEAPDWYFEPPEPTQGIIGVGYGKSSDPQMAMEIAKMEAAGNIAQTYNAEVSKLVKNYKAQNQGSEPVLRGTLSSTTDLFVNATDISGAQSVDSKHFVADGYVHYYVQMFMPFDSANLIKLERANAEAEKAVKASAAAAHQELRDRVEGSAIAAQKPEAPSSTN
ncbi:MAG: hypothetical protein C9356_15265 [Oleiphilus sp.]|nr:MAG: hypothetical protein C9356_15265 [Oleiphilus sp.]